MTKRPKTIQPATTSISVPGRPAPSNAITTVTDTALSQWGGQVPATIAMPDETELPLPVAIAELGPQSSERFGTFFTDQTNSPHTRAAYGRAAGRFFSWCSSQGLGFHEVKSFHVSAYVAQLERETSKPTAKQHLAAIRRLFDWLVVGQVCAINPAAAVRGPRHSVTKGKIPILDEGDATKLLESIDASTVIGARDRALIAVMVYTFGRVSAVLGMNVGDYYPNGKFWWLRLHEKNGRDHEMPAHHKLVGYLDAHLQSAGIADQKDHPLFPTAPRGAGGVTSNRLDPRATRRMILRRAKGAGIETPISPHSFRGTGITSYLQNGGSLIEAQKMAAHADPRTTRLYDRTADAVMLGEVEKIGV